ncbi:UDP-N-acetylglucosamine transporter-like isoform X2 [Gigantopelta aegis]|nr:UDP-N-acetylglucosamine transporter-like isoform X2 [Gigantopelta aegis]
MERKKVVSLATLVIQTTCLVLTMRYSRITQAGSPRYITSTAVVTSEVLKLFTCCVIMYLTNDRSLSIAKTDIVKQMKEILRLAVPSGLYTIQNNLQFVAVSNLDAATFQVTYQLKILTTAVFSVMFLGRHLTVLKWLSLVLLTAGVGLVQIPKSKSDCYLDSTGELVCNPTKDSDKTKPLIGLIAVSVMCVSSGFAGVYFEKILKSSSQSLWARNFQLAVSSVVMGSFCMILFDYEALIKYGFFYGYTLLTWFVVFQQAAIGLVVSLVIKYADNILKGFASAISIVLSTLVSILVLGDLTPTSMYFLGTFLVVGATFLYSINQTTRKQNGITSSV